MLAAPPKRKTPSVIVFDDKSSKVEINHYFFYFLKLPCFYVFVFFYSMSFEKTFAFCVSKNIPDFVWKKF